MTYQASSCRATSTSVLITSVQIAATNITRRGFVIFNNSANSCYVSFVNPSVAANCIRIIPTFASWEVYGPTIYTGPIYCVRNAGTGNVTFWEIM